MEILHTIENLENKEYFMNLQKGLVADETVTFPKGFIFKNVCIHEPKDGGIYWSVSIKDVMWGTHFGYTDRLSEKPNGDIKEYKTISGCKRGLKHFINTYFGKKFK